MKAKLLMIALSIIVVCFSCSKGQNRENNQNIEKEVFKYDNISLNSVEEFEEKRNKKFDYELYKTLNFDLDFDNVVDTIKLFRLSKWADPGDYHKIEIITQKSNFNLSNVNGWSDMDKVRVDLSQNRYILNSILIVGNSNYGSYIFLTGYPYASDPPQLTILKTTDKTELIFNVNSFISAIYDNDSNFHPIIRIGRDAEIIDKVELIGDSLYKVQ